jgi:hypothetical protein
MAEKLTRRLASGALRIQWLRSRHLTQGRSGYTLETCGAVIPQRAALFRRRPAEYSDGLSSQPVPYACCFVCGEIRVEALLTGSDEPEPGWTKIQSANGGGAYIIRGNVLVVRHRDGRELAVRLNEPASAKTVALLVLSTRF